MSDERFKSTLSVVIGIVTLITVIIGFLQNDASARDDRAGRDAQMYALQALETRLSGAAQVEAEYGAFRAWDQLDTLALSAALAEDDAASARYYAVRDEMRTLSPLLSDAYFDPDAYALDLPRYESDVYLLQVTRLTQQFVASAAVKDGWDTKANTYVVHLTLLAVSLFLFGLSTTISGRLPRLIFALFGLGTAIFAAGWAGLVYAQPVYDLREVSGAIDRYAEGVVLSHQGRYEEAITAFDASLAVAPDYAIALIDRGFARQGIGDLAGAAADLEQGQAAGGDSVYVAGNLAYIYYLLGRFDDAVTMNRQALAIRADELWIQFDLAAALLASGQVESARAEYESGMNLAIAEVAAARTAGLPINPTLWWSLDDGANELLNLLSVIDTGWDYLPPGSVSTDPAVRSEAEALFTRLKSLSVALELTGAPPAGDLTARIGALSFGEPIYDENGEIVDANMTDVFTFGTREVWALYTFEGMNDGDQVLFKVYIDGSENYALRVQFTWDEGSSGETGVLVSQTLSRAYALGTGLYRVEMYVNNQLAQRGEFFIEEGE